MKILRRKTRQIMCGNVKIGSDAPIPVQSMTNTDTRDVEATVEQIKALMIPLKQMIQVRKKR